MGPITTRPQYEKVLDYIRIAKEEGAVCRLGGGPADAAECGSGWFVEPTIFTGVQSRDAHREGRSIRSGAFGDSVRR